MGKDLVSVILPAYNAECFLKEAIDSILAQTFTNFELIIINDGSTDRTEEIILSYDDPRIRYVKNENNLKLIKTLNKGVDLAKGKYIARMDADDISLPTRLEKEVKYMEEHPECGVVSCFPFNMNMQGKVLGKSSYFTVTRPIPCKFVSIFEPPICHPVCMFRAEIIKRYKYRDDVDCLHVEAYELWNRMFFSGIKGGMIPEYMLYYRDNTNSICHVYNGEQWSRQLKIFKNSLKKYLNIEYDDKILLCIIQKLEINDIHVIDGAFHCLEESCKSFSKNELNITKTDAREIRTWIRQRKLAILMASFMSASNKMKLRILFKFISNISLLFCLHSIAYIKNRIIRIVNEK